MRIVGALILVAAFNAALWAILGSDWCAFACGLSLGTAVMLIAGEIEHGEG